MSFTIEPFSRPTHKGLGTSENFGIIAFLHSATVFTLKTQKFEGKYDAKIRNEFLFTLNCTLKPPKT